MSSSACATSSPGTPSRSRSPPSIPVKRTARSSRSMASSKRSVTVTSCAGQTEVCPAVSRGFRDSFEGLDEDVDLAAAREPDGEGVLVGDPVGDELRLARLEHAPGALVDVGLDAAARDRAGQLAALRHGQLGADRPRRGAPGRHHGRNRHLLAALPPAGDVGQDLLHAACLLSIPASTSASSSRLARLCPGRKRSTYGKAARIPPASGWYSGWPLSGFTQTTA